MSLSLDNDCAAVCADVRQASHDTFVVRDENQRLVEAAFEQVLARPPSQAEQTAAIAFLARQVRLFRASPPPAVAATVPGDAPSTDPARRAPPGALTAAG